MLPRVHVHYLNQKQQMPCKPQMFNVLSTPTDTNLDKCCISPFQINVLEAAAVVAHYKQFLNMALLWYIILQLTHIRNNNKFIMNVL